jgi:hypothetical protein
MGTKNLVELAEVAGEKGCRRLREIRKLEPELGGRRLGGLALEVLAGMLRAGEDREGAASAPIASGRRLAISATSGGGQPHKESNRVNTRLGQNDNQSDHYQRIEQRADQPTPNSTPDASL